MDLQRIFNPFVDYDDETIAEKLNVRGERVRKWAREGLIQPDRVGTGKTHIFSGSEVIRAIEENKFLKQRLKDQPTVTEKILAVLKSIDEKLDTLTGGLYLVIEQLKS